jgi:DNA-binding CsgD family transcriptional regulator
VWDSERCAPDAGAVEPPQICAADHLHHPRIDARVHRDLAASYVVMAPLVSATAEARLVFVRRTRDFDERDHTVLGLLRPHLASAYRRCTERRGRVDALTPRQRVVLHLVARGCSNDEIASRLVLSPGTVRKHLDNAFRQLGVSSRAAAVARAFPEGVPPYPLELRDTPLVSVPRQRAN